ncbi:hypothetical protein AB0Q95_45495 [Streptomyces sp. NPDC059900]|uniref:hypothetical protein n=1 Tax=Streptomyces sp. NPDC059900 TaxID=3155816 RepID=UPI003412E562
MTKLDRLPDPKSLNCEQLHEQACALCGARLFRDRFLGAVRHPYTPAEFIELWACAPQCRAAVR